MIQEAASLILFCALGLAVIALWPEPNRRSPFK
jgi:hypothetical protein